jgi:hypothetical protein
LMLTRESEGVDLDKLTSHPCMGVSLCILDAMMLVHTRTTTVLRVSPDSCPSQRADVSLVDPMSLQVLISNLLPSLSRGEDAAVAGGVGVAGKGAPEEEVHPMDDSSS